MIPSTGVRPLREDEFAAVARGPAAVRDEAVDLLVTVVRCSLNTPQRLNDRVVHRIHDGNSCRGITAHCYDVHIF